VRPFDPRLLRHIPALRRDVALLGALGALVAVSIVAAAFGLARALSGELRWLPLFVAAFAARAVLTSACGLVAARMAATVKATLRKDLVEAVGRRGPEWLAGQRAGELATLSGRGLDGLDGYFEGYLPQLVLSVTVPFAVLVTLGTADLASAIIVLVTLPLIPIFGILIGWQTQAATEKQWRRLSTLGGHFLDMVTGLPTLKVFGRARAQVRAVREMADRHRVATMRTLRIAFLPALVLEIVGTISVALVAVPVGLRLLGGGLTLPVALLVLLLTPEAFAPLRSAGSRFHASMEGLTALDQAFALLSAPDGAGGTALVSPPFTIELRGVSVEYERGTALSNVDLVIREGERIALVGPSGSGKSTLLNLLLGFTSPTSGEILVNGVELSTLDMSRWRSHLAWVPQRAHLFAGTLAENIALGNPSASRDDIERAAASAALPYDLSRVLGERGHGMSSGERQRLALARAFLRDAPLLLLDEPTARLDVESEKAVVEATLRLAEGRTAVLVAHRPALLSVATRVLRLEHGRLREEVRV
jgi:ATP-binding cassette, subfamily C, bacterial CydD